MNCSSPLQNMDIKPRKRAKTTHVEFEEVTSIKWKTIRMTEQEEDLISRMHRLVGDRWVIIAGRIPGRKPEEIERFWLMSHNEEFAGMMTQQ
ncbi:hypothetical protein AQUCO_01300134v1 [Aquilegia coerulea]|uniref:Myb-like domain-containing protein n=1 Tax=Aquilegia coerulea TaxID=218851 RepID=A0A2G5DZW8_AQUCA|nr:hypothetical protein AQUCO_01300134v1 [Aquilegia coerulea]